MTILDRFFATPPAPTTFTLFLIGFLLGATIVYLPGVNITQYPGTIAFFFFISVGGVVNFAAAWGVRMKLFHVFLWTLAGIAAFPLSYIPTYLLLTT